MKRDLALKLLESYLDKKISVKEMIDGWPKEPDPLLDTIVNMYFEQIDPVDISDQEIAITAIKAIRNNWPEEAFDKKLDDIFDSK